MSVFAVFIAVIKLLGVFILGASLTAVTVKVKVCTDEYEAPSYTLAVMVAEPFQLEAGVSVRVVPDTLTTTFDVDEFAE